jgi:hypothetical protein
MEHTTIHTTSSVTIQGAQRACELEPAVRQACVRVSHAPASNAQVSSASAGPTEIEPSLWEADEPIAPGAEVWQELVRMLVAREAAKLMHPAGRARANVA